MRDIRIRIRDAAFDRLVDESLRQWRAPAEQASYMLERSLLRTKAAPRAALSTGPAEASRLEAGDGR